MPLAQIDASLFDQLMRAFATYPKDVLTIARVERDARSVMKQHPAVGYEILGACAAARGDRDAAKHNHEASLRIAPNNVNAWSNFMVSLSILNDIESVREKAFVMGDRFPHNPQALLSAMNTLTELGLLSSAAQFFQQHPAVQEAVPLDYSWVEDVDAVLQGRGVSEDDFANAVVGARDFLTRKGLVRSEYSCRYLPDDMGGLGEIAYGFHVRSDADQAHELERALFRYLGDAQMVAEERGAVTFYVGFTTEEGETAGDAVTAC